MLHRSLKLIFQEWGREWGCQGFQEFAVNFVKDLEDCDWPKLADV